MQFGKAVASAVPYANNCSRQITTPTPHHSIFSGQMLFLMPNQQCQSTEGIHTLIGLRLQLVFSEISINLATNDVFLQWRCHIHCQFRHQPVTMLRIRYFMHFSLSVLQQFFSVLLALSLLKVDSSSLVSSFRLSFLFFIKLMQLCQGYANVPSVL